MTFNIFDWIIGNPYNKQANEKYNKALKALKSARKRHDRKAEIKALAVMKSSSKDMQQTANKVISKVETIDKKIAMTTTLPKKAAIAAASLVAVVVLFRVMKK